jgi:hypothetical protein
MKRKRLGAPSRATVLARDRREPTHVAFFSSFLHHVSEEGRWRWPLAEPRAVGAGARSGRGM